MEESWAIVVGAASKLGLTVQIQEATGLVEGRPIRIKLEPFGEQVRLVVHSRLDPPLDLGLTMRRNELTLNLPGKVTTGSDDLDSEFTVKGDDPSRVRELFTEDLAGHLFALHRAALDLWVHDRGCEISDKHGFALDEAWVIRAAEGAARTVALLDASRAKLRAAAPFAAHAEALSTFAAARDLTFTSTPLTVAGLLDGRPIRLGSERTSRNRYHLTARASFESALGLRLSVQRREFFDRLSAMFGVQGLRVGDAAFDRRFLVEANPPEAARIVALFDREARLALLALDERIGPLTLDDRAVTLGPIPPAVAPEALVWAMDALADTCARIDRNLLYGAGSVGPYR